MKLAMVIYSNDPETVWNAFRFGVHALKGGDVVSVFLLGRGVEAEGLSEARFPVVATMKEYISTGGALLACGTCLKLREQVGSELCPVSTLADLHTLIRNSDKVLTF